MRAKFVNNEYAEALLNINKFISKEAISTLNDILENSTSSPTEKIKEIVALLEYEVDDELDMHKYFSEGGTLEGFANYIYYRGYED